MPKKRVEKVKEGRHRTISVINKYSIIGALIGIVLAGIIFILIFIPYYNERYESTCVAGENKINFDISDTHLSISEDFASGLPIYDGEYCKKEFLEKYNKPAFSCVISRVDTHTRMNPMVTKVGCICEE